MLTFNWGRLDDFSAAALSCLINEKLCDVFAHRNERARGCTPSPLLIDHLELTSFKWGNAPPFLELLQLRPALDIGDSSLPQQHQSTAQSAAPSRSQDKNAGTSSTSPHRGPPLQRATTTTTAAAAAATASTASPLDRRKPTLCTTRFAAEPEAASPAPTAGSAVSAVTHRGASAPLSTASAATTVHEQAHGQGYAGGMMSSTSDFSGSTPNPTPRSDADALAPYIGDSGLFLQFHLTYGGDASASLSAEVTKVLDLGPRSVLKMSVPGSLDITGLKLNVIVNVNLHKSTCVTWLEPGPVGPFLDPLRVVATFGSHDGIEKETRDEEAISALITSELRAIIRHKLMAPHYVTIPIALPDRTGTGTPSSPLQQEENCADAAL